MSNIKKALVFIVFLFLVSHAYAQDYALFSGKFYEFYGLREGQEKIEFEFYNGTHNICENERKAIPILVANNDKTDNKFSLEAIGASWIRLNADEFSLPKKQSGIVFLELSPQQNTRGNYNIKVNAVSSVGNVEKELDLSIQVEGCYAINLEIEKEEERICGGVKKEYRGELFNNGEQKSDIEIGVSGPNWIGIGKNTFSVDANSSQKFELSIDVPANAKGTFNAVVSAVIKNLPSIKSEKILKLDVVPKYDCYKADIIADSKITNYYSNAYIPIKIRNGGTRQAAYGISLEAPSWISIEPKKLSVNPEQFGSLSLNINPGASVPEGDYAIKLNIKFEDIVYSRNIDVILARENEFFKAAKSFFVFYKYYIYAVAFMALILLIFRRRIANKIKARYKSYKIRKARLRALEAARKARQLKRQASEAKEAEKAEFEAKKITTSRSKALAFAAAIILAFLLFSIYQFDLPISKELLKGYYAYFIAGILISAFAIFLIEAYQKK